MVAQADQYVVHCRSYYSQNWMNHDSELLEGLHKAGFKTNMGLYGDGPLQLAWDRGGGYYLGEPFRIIPTGARR